MPGAGIADFPEHAKAIARAGIYDLSLHHDSILKPVILGHWDVANREGLTPSAQSARDRLVQFITRMGRAAARTRAPRAEAAVAGPH
jgi:acyl-[acyl-carrier-protein] desaturase